MGKTKSGVFALGALLATAGLAWLLATQNPKSRSTDSDPETAGPSGSERTRADIANAQGLPTAPLDPQSLAQMDTPGSEPSWVTDKYAGRTLNDLSYRTVLEDWHREDWGRIGPVLEDLAVNMFGWDFDELIASELPVGEAGPCLERMKERFLEEFSDPGTQNVLLWSLPGALGVTGTAKVLERIEKDGRYNPGKRSLDRKSQAYRDFVLLLDAELNTLTEWKRALSAQQVSFIAADLKPVDEVRQAAVGKIFMGPILTTSHRDVPAVVEEPVFTTYLPGVGSSNFEECGSLMATYAIDWRNVPSIHSEILAVLDYKSGVVDHLRQAIELVP